MRHLKSILKLLHLKWKLTSCKWPLLNGHCINCTSILYWPSPLSSLHLSRCSRGSIAASGAAIVLAQRKSGLLSTLSGRHKLSIIMLSMLLWQFVCLLGEFLDHETTRRLEQAGGTAVLDSLTQYPLDENVTFRYHALSHTHNIKHKTYINILFFGCRKSCKVMNVCGVIQIQKTKLLFK